jgi:hypothetical protein
MGNYDSVNESGKDRRHLLSIADSTDSQTEDYRVQMFAAKCIASDDPRLKP